MDTVSKYPLDFEQLEKGQRITQAELEEIFSCTPTDPTWGFRAMKLVEDIKSNVGLLARQSRHSIVIMTDEEAAEYTYEAMFKRGVRKMGAAVRNRQLIDKNELSAAVLAIFESKSRIMTGTQQATLSALRKQTRVENLLAAKACVRQQFS